jgi:hypothetical protein
VPELPVGILLESFEKSTSEIFWAAGNTRAIPKSRIIITDTSLKVSADIPKLLTRTARKSVKKVKLKINPRTIPNGFLCPPTLPDRTIGKMGSIQGDKIVTIPAIKAKSVSITI